MRPTRWILPTMMILLAAGPLHAQDRHRDILAENLQGRLDSLANDFDGVAGIQIVDLVDGRRIGANQDLVFPQGSAIKIPILLELFRRAEDDPDILLRRVEITDDVAVGGSGVLQHLTRRGSALSLEDLAVLMITESDNTATNVLIRTVGMDAVNALMDRLGAPSTRLQREMIRPDASARGEENLSTPAEAAMLMARIHRCDLPLSEAACTRVRDILEIPKGGPVGAPIPSGVPVAFKPGGVEGVTTVWALVGLPGRPYALAVMSTYGGDGGALVRASSEAAWGYFSKLARATEHGVRVPLDVLLRERGDTVGGTP
ncbi:MAG: class A beta-lactamase-related serine hydrolase [Gemmatimonadetes bacterium]|nr:class A beta-lactamase-related serine hydrolase [Gemmatimonadota bacterium]